MNLSLSTARWSLSSVVSSFPRSSSRFRPLPLSPAKLSLAFPQVGVCESHSAVHARKRSSDSERPILSPNIVDEVSLDDEDELQEGKTTLFF